MNLKLKDDISRKDIITFAALLVGLLFWTIIVFFVIIPGK